MRMATENFILVKCFFGLKNRMNLSNLVILKFSNSIKVAAPRDGRKTPLVFLQYPFLPNAQDPRFHIPQGP